MKPPKWAPAAAATTCLVLGGFGATLALGATPSPEVQVVSTGCVVNGAGGRAPRGHCVYTLTDGRRFQCPLRFGNHPQTPASLEQAKACHRLAAIRIPATWKPALDRLARVEACLTRHRVTVRGGPDFTDNPKRTPIGELLMSGTGPTALIGFYMNAGVARRAVPGIRRHLEGSGGSLRREGAVTVAWLGPPAPATARTAYGCAF